MAPIRNGRPGRHGRRYRYDQPNARTPPIFFGFVPLPTTKPTKYAHTLSVIRIDKAHFVRQFNRTKYPYKGCYLLSVHMLGI